MAKTHAADARASRRATAIRGAGAKLAVGRRKAGKALADAGGAHAIAVAIGSADRALARLASPAILTGARATHALAPRAAAMRAGGQRCFAAAAGEAIRAKACAIEASAVRSAPTVASTLVAPCAAPSCLARALPREVVAVAAAGAVERTREHRAIQALVAGSARAATADAHAVALAMPQRVTRGQRAIVARPALVTCTLAAKAPPVATAVPCTLPHCAVETVPSRRADASAVGASAVRRRTHRITAAPLALRALPAGLAHAASTLADAVNAAVA